MERLDRLQIVALPCIDPQRIHCTGYSNGARFCTLGRERGAERKGWIGCKMNNAFPLPPPAVHRMFLIFGRVLLTSLPYSLCFYPLQPWFEQGVNGKIL